MLVAAGLTHPVQWHGQGISTFVVIALRADFYAHCAQFDHLRRALATHQEFIGPMSAEELRRAIEGPAHQGGWTFEPGLVDLLLQDVSDEPGALPLLWHALLETWRRWRGRMLTFSGYGESGRAQGAIAKTADRVLQGMAPERQAIARSIFVRLTGLGEGTQDTRRQASPASAIARKITDQRHPLASQGCEDQLTLVGRLAGNGIHDFGHQTQVVQAEGSARR